MKNGIFKLDWASVIDAMLTGAITAVLTGLISIVSTSGFDLFATNWVLVGHNMANLAFISVVVSLGKDLLSTTSGSVLGISPENPS